MQRPQNKKNQGPRINRQIRVSPIRVIDSDGSQLGVIPTEEAGRLAREQGLDLVEIQPNQRPPVCKIIDFGKWKYEQKKKTNEIKKKQKKVELKEIKFRPKTDVHDFEFKVKKIVGFLEEGNRVKVTIMFRGREMIHTHLGNEMLTKIAGRMNSDVGVDARPKMEGRSLFMTLSPPKKE